MSVTLPKGTVLHLHGCPIELTEDTPVNGTTIEGYGSLEAFEAAWQPGQSENPKWKQNLREEVKEASSEIDEQVKRQRQKDDDTLKA